MSIQLVIVPKAALFETDAIADRYHEFFRELVSYSFPDDLDVAASDLATPVKQMFLASMRKEIGDAFFGGKATLTADFFDHWWTLEGVSGMTKADLEASNDLPAVKRLEWLDRKTREEILAQQSDSVKAAFEKLLSFDDRPQGPDADGLLYEATDYFMPFPKTESVFAEDVATHAKYLLPLATVSLEHINPAWSGPIHFVQPIEPFDGVVGGDTPAHHGSLCAENWVGYHINEDGKYTLATSWDFFLLHNVESRTDIQIGADATRCGYEHYESARQSFAKNLSHFQQFGGLHPEYSLENHGFWRDRDRHQLVMQLGGEPGWGNWPEIGDWPLSEYESQKNDAEPDETYPVPQSDDGSDFAYIGWMRSSTYVETSPCGLQLFYHPEQRIALTTFDWS